MTPIPQEMIRLLRLVFTELQHASDSQIRERLETDERLKRIVQRWQRGYRLSRKVGKAQLWSTLDLGHAETIARVLDGAVVADSPELALLMQSAAATDELLALSRTESRGFRTKGSKESSDPLLLSMQRTLDGLLAASTEPLITRSSASDNLSRVIESPLAFDPQAPLVVKPVEPIVISINPRPSPMRLPNQPRASRKTSSWLIWGSVAIAIAVVVGWVGWLANRGSQSNETDTAERGSVERESPAPPQPNRLPEHELNETPDSIDDQPRVPQRPLDSRPFTPMLVESENESEEMEDPFLMETSIPNTPSPNPPSPNFQGKSRVALLWRESNGLVAQRGVTETEWSSITPSSQAQEQGSSFSKVVRSLGDSWAAGLLVAGDNPASGTLVVGPQAHAEITATHQRVWRWELDVKAGRLALTDLPEGTVLQLTHLDRTTELHVTSAQATIGFDATESTFAVIVALGSIEIDERATAAPSEWLALDDRWHERSQVRRVDWIETPPRLSEIEVALANQLAADSNLVAGILANRSLASPSEMTLATNWTFELDPTQAIPLALQSSVLLQRSLAVNWLLDRTHSIDSIRPVIRAMQAALPTTQRNVPRWISVMRGETPLQRTVVLDMVEGLDSREPLVVREMAASFLRVITGSELAGYDPTVPSRQTLQRSRAAVQAWLNR